MINIPQIVQDKCPVWSGRIKEQSFRQLEYASDSNGMYTDIGDAKCCVVGEAHGFSEKYWHEDYMIFGREDDYSENDACRECTIYSRDFNRFLRVFPNREQFQFMLDNFGKHLELCHNEKENVIEQEIVPQLPLVVK